MLFLVFGGIGLIAAFALFSVEDQTVQEIKPVTTNQNSTGITTTTTQDEYELSLENSKNSQLMPKEAIDKEILSGHVFGFTPDNGLRGGMSSIGITHLDEKISIRFTSKFSGEITKIIMYSGGQENLKVRGGLQEDNLGEPSGTWIGGSAETVLHDGESKFATLNFFNGINLKENQVYHIVIEPQGEILENKFFLITYHSNWPFTPFNYKDPDLTWKDDAINTLFFDGIKWRVQDKWPIYVLEYSNGISDGQPYSLFAPWVIKESSMVGQTLKPFSNYLVDEFAFVVSSTGNPPDDLYYTVYDEENKIIRSGIFATPNDLTNEKIWHHVKLESPMLVESGKIYRFILSSENSDLENSYKIYGHEFMLDRTLGYGSVTHHLTKSTDGVKWSKWYDADTAFKLIIN